MAGRGEAGASYDGASWGEAGRGEIMTERSGAGIQLNPRNFPEFEFY